MSIVSSQLSGARPVHPVNVNESAPEPEQKYPFIFGQIASYLSGRVHGCGRVHGMFTPNK